MSAITAGIELPRLKQSRKAADWKNVCDNHPDVADHIREFSAVFGAPASLKVTENDGSVILNSEWYGR